VLRVLGLSCSLLRIGESADVLRSLLVIDRWQLDVERLPCVLDRLHL